jgi:hypothetical protein
MAGCSPDGPRGFPRPRRGPGVVAEVFRPPDPTIIPGLALSKHRPMFPPLTPDSFPGEPPGPLASPGERPSSFGEFLLIGIRVQSKPCRTVGYARGQRLEALPC